jgi:SAM-dependent methyltransferase
MISDSTSAPNAYYNRQLTDAEISAKEHREWVGGLWHELGALQFELKAQGLQPHHRLLDVGCGALRGGLHFVRYLDTGHYYGLDLNASLIDAGRRELREAGLEGKHPHFLVSDSFEVSRFGQRFDYSLAQSVFTHLPMTIVAQCVAEVGKVLDELRVVGAKMPRMNSGKGVMRFGRSTEGSRGSRSSERREGTPRHGRGLGGPG